MQYRKTEVVSKIKKRKSVLLRSRNSKSVDLTLKVEMYKINKEPQVLIYSLTQTGYQKLV